MTAPLRITITLEGEQVVDRVLRGIEARARDVSPAWPAVVQAFHSIVARAFATEGASTGAPWAPLAPATQVDRTRQGFGAAHPILKRHGTLERALTLGEGAYVATSTTSLRYIIGGETGEIFAYHQSTRPRMKLPRRAPVLFTADDRTALVHPLRVWLTGRDPNAAQRAPIR